MLFSIAMALMVILIAGFWTYQGFFSAALMFFECMIACAVAFGFYESLNTVWAATLGSGVGLPLAFAVLFLAVLVVLRLATDRLLPDDIKFPVIADRAGAAIFGLFTGLLLVGMALIGIQMLPIGADVFGFDRVQTKADGSTSTGGFMLSPDGFALGLANMASSGGLSGGNPLGRAKPDMLMDLYGARSSVQTEDRHEIPADSIKVNAYWEARQIDQVKQRLEGKGLVREFETKESTIGKFLVFDITLDRNACLKDKAELYLRVPQFRLVGPPPESGTPKVYLACGMNDIYINKQANWIEVQEGQATRLVRFRPDTDFYLSPAQAKPVAELVGKADAKSYRINVAFEVPNEGAWAEPGGNPWYLAFKTGARVEINKQKMFKPTPPKNAAVALGNTGPGRTASEAAKPKVGKAPGGTTHIANAIEERTGVITQLPLPLSRSDSQVSRALKGGKLGECHFAVDVPDKAPSKADQVTDFFVPEGKKMVQVGAEKNFAGSTFGRALNYASNVAGQVSITSAEGQTYVAQGVYSAAKVGGKMVLEIQYIENADESDLRLKPAKKVTANVLKNAPAEERKFGFIFIVDPGVKITGFSSGGKGGTQPLNIDVPK